MSRLLAAPELPTQLLQLTVLKLISSAPHAGFLHARSTPVRVLSDLLTTYLERLAENARMRAEMAARTRPGLRDAVAAVSEYDCGVEDLLVWAREQRDAQSAEPSADEKRFKALGSLLNSAFCDASYRADVKRSFTSRRKLSLDASSST